MSSGGRKLPRAGRGAVLGLGVALVAGLLQMGAVPTAAARPQTGAPAAKAATAKSGTASGTTSDTTSGAGVASAASEEEAVAAAKRSGKSVEVASLRGESSD